MKNISTVYPQVPVGGLSHFDSALNKILKEAGFTREQFSKKVMATFQKAQPGNVPLQKELHDRLLTSLDAGNVSANRIVEIIRMVGLDIESVDINTKPLDIKAFNLAHAANAVFMQSAYRAMKELLHQIRTKYELPCRIHVGVLHRISKKDASTKFTINLHPDGCRTGNAPYKILVKRDGDTNNVFIESSRINHGDGDIRFNYLVALSEIEKPVRLIKVLVQYISDISSK